MTIDSNFVRDHHGFNKESVFHEVVVDADKFVRVIWSRSSLHYQVNSAILIYIYKCGENTLVVAELSELVIFVRVLILSLSNSFITK